MQLFNPPSRRVRHLRLRAVSVEHARHAATSIEDALRTASLPDADRGRLVLIRRLALGRIAAHASPALVALCLERAARDAVVCAVPADSAAAANADVIRFEDGAEAVALLARRLARRAAVAEWFWPVALPGWNSGGDRSAQWLCLLAIAHTLPAPALAAAAVVREAVAENATAELLDALPAGIGHRWLRTAGFNAASRDVEVESFSVAPEILHVRGPRLESVLLSFASPARCDDDRVLWLATIAAVADNPRRAADPTLPARVRAAITAAINRRYEPDLEPARPASVETLLQGDDVAVAGQGAAPTTACVSADFISGRGSDELAAVPGEFTAFGGLLFVLPVLERLQFPAWLAAQPALVEAGFGIALLETLARHIGTDANDPLLRALNLSASHRTEVLVQSAFSTANRMELPPVVCELLARPPLRKPVAEPFDLWIAAARRWCRRRARIGLHSLVVRRARVVGSTLQLDVHFALDQVDLRVRRAGLDLDPGWVPWLGRIVRFHYHDDFRS